METKRMVKPGKKNHKKGKNVSSDDDEIVKLTANLLDLCSQNLPPNQNNLWTEHLEIRRLLKEIEIKSKIDENSKKNDEKREKFLQPFISWCDKINLHRTNTEIMQISDKGFGLVAKQLSTVGDVLVKVPFKAMLTMESARKSDFKILLERDPLIKEMPNVALAMLLLNEKLKGKESFWFDYVNFLPNFYTTPLYFEPDQILTLKGSFYFEESLKMWRNIVRQFSYFHQILTSSESLFAKTAINLGNFDFESYRWATVTVMTRVNMVPDVGSGNRPQPALIPYLDMANHDPNLQPCTDFDESSNSAMLYSGISYEPGQEICMYYGHRTNGEFLLHNGFIPECQNSDLLVLNFRLGLTKSDALFNLKWSTLKALGLDKPYFSLALKNLSRDLNQCLLFSMVFCAESKSALDQLENFENDKLFEADFAQILKECDKNLREKAINFLKIRFNLLLKAYQNQNNDKKQDGDHEKLTKALISQEKEILHKALSLL